MKKSGEGNPMLDKDSIIKFLENCVNYSEQSILRKESRGEQDSILPWLHYKQHTEYALIELKEGKLDHWLTDESKLNPSRNDKILSSNPERLDIQNMNHPDRAKILTSMISPRPIGIVSTRNSNGSINLAPISSIMSPSNSPPYVLISLSQTRDGRKRDTYENLRKDGNAFIHFLPPTMDMARLADDSGQQLEVGISELDELNLQASPLNELLMSNSLYAIETTFKTEYEMPDAVAKLCLLEIKAIWKHADLDATKPVEVLCQHGMDRLVPIHDSWSFIATKHYN